MVRMPELLRCTPGVDADEGQWRQDPQGQSRREEQHESEPIHRCDDDPAGHDGAVGDGALNQRDVRDRASHHVADGVTGEESRSLLLKLVVEQLPQVEGDAQSHPSNPEASVCEEAEAECHHRENREKRHEQVGIARFDAVDAHFDEQRHSELEHPADEEQHDAAGHLPSMFAQKYAKAQKRSQICLLDSGNARCQNVAPICRNLVLVRQKLAF
jgi:hypothetical protein